MEYVNEFDAFFLDGGQVLLHFLGPVLAFVYSNYAMFTCEASTTLQAQTLCFHLPLHSLQVLQVLCQTTHIPACVCT